MTNDAVRPTARVPAGTAAATATGRFRTRDGGGGGSATLLRIGPYGVPQGWRIPLRITEFHVLFVGVSGRLRFHVGGVEHLLQPGSTLWLPRHRAHEATAPYPVSSQVVVLHFTLPPQEHPELPRARLWALDAAGAEAITHRCTAMIERLSSGSASDDHRADAELNLLLADLLDRPTDPGATRIPSERPGRAGEIARVLDHIARHTDESLGTAELARIAGLQRGHFSTVFKTLTGLSPGQYVTAARVARARELLEFSSLTQEVIAERCGFASASHLARRFKELEGMPPGVYRERHARARAELGLSQRDRR